MRTVSFFSIKAALFAAALTMTALTAEAEGGSDTQSGSDTQTILAELQYERNGQGVTITDFGNIGRRIKIPSLVIPNRINGLPVTAIRNDSIVFFPHPGIRSVTIPSSVTEIGNSAFRDCTSLTSVTIPDSVTTIGEAAFSSCTRLSNVTIPGSITSIEATTFFYCTSLNSVTILGSVTTIGRSAFQQCTSLTSFAIPPSVTILGDSAFRNCTGLTSVTIPGSVTTIGGYTFFGSGITSVTFAYGSYISSSNFNDSDPFPGDLRTKYLANGPGTYTRPNNTAGRWTKQ